jgi:hypothetical protein
MSVAARAPIDRRRLARVLALLASPYDGEAAAAGASGQCNRPAGRCVVGRAARPAGDTARAAPICTARCRRDHRCRTRAVSLPAKPQLHGEGRVRTDLAGKRLYSPCVEIPSSEVRSKFRELALAALDRLLDQGDAV